MATSPVVNLAQLLDSAETVLAAEFDGVPADVIHALVVREASHYRQARVHDYVPLLVARAVRARLREYVDWIRLPQAVASA
jgi:glutaredoxin-related protein